MDRRLISVVIPTCHRDESLARCLDCLDSTAQTFAPEEFEVIVTDDAKDGATAPMLAARYPWAQWIAGPRRGPAANRNHGAKHASGEFIAFTDDDCLPEPKWLESFAKAVIPEISVYEGRTTCVAGADPLWDEVPVNMSGGCLWSCNMMIRKKLFDEIGGFDENYPHSAYEDVDLRERLLAVGHEMKFVADAVVDHPPRRRAQGRRAAERWEARVLYWYKHGEQRSCCRPLLMHALKFRAGQLVHARSGAALLRAGLSMCVELLHLMVMVPRWDSKYRQMYRRPVA